MRFRGLVGCMVIGLLSLGSPALAHVAADDAPAAAPAVSSSSGVETIAAAAPEAGGLGMLLAAAVAALVIVRRRRAVGLACIALLLVIAFETGLHSVHHIVDERDAASCVVALATAQAGGLAVESVAFERPAEVGTPVAVRSDTSTPVRSSAPDLGRAPPAA
jgi:hypothetical protein